MDEFENVNFEQNQGAEVGDKSLSGLIDRRSIRHDIKVSNASGDNHDGPSSCHFTESESPNNLSSMTPEKNRNDLSVRSKSTDAADDKVKYLKPIKEVAFFGKT